MVGKGVTAASSGWMFGRGQVEGFFPSSDFTPCARASESKGTGSGDGMVRDFNFPKVACHHSSPISVRVHVVHVELRSGDAVPGYKGKRMVHKNCPPFFACTLQGEVRKENCLSKRV